MVLGYRLQVKGKKAYFSLLSFLSVIFPSTRLSVPLPPSVGVVLAVRPKKGPPLSQLAFNQINPSSVATNIIHPHLRVEPSRCAE